jgi:HK97 family phage prohead protease
MTELLHRATATDLEVRSHGDGRTICGIACPFGEPAEVADRLGRPYTETIVHGAFARTIVERGGRVKARAQHDRSVLPVGSATLLREDARGLYAELRIAQTSAGDDVLELVREGHVNALSVAFNSVRDDWNATRSAVSRLEVRLFEISVVDEPAYASALIAGVRSASHLPTAEVRRRRLEILYRSIP